MRIAYLDCYSGISGDMFLGALVSAGVPFELLQKTLAELKIGAVLERSRVDRSGVSATKVDVVVHGEKDLPREEFWAQQHRHEGENGHRHEHAVAQLHEHAHTETRSHSDELGHAHKHAHGRPLSDIQQIIAAAAISDNAKRTASRIFQALGEAEAKVHNTDVEHVHFHEVGAEDAIVDVICAAVGSEALGVEQFISSPLNVGSGTVACVHGVLPVPAPATLELLSGIPIFSGEIQKELVTPTGAAIVKVLVKSFQARPAMKTETVGYGAGSRDFPGHPNVLRLSVGETVELNSSDTLSSQRQVEEISILEANVDDLNPQLIGYIVESAFAQGALDVFTTPVQMKKNRPGTVLTVLAPPQDEGKMRDLIFRESSTLGIRVRRQKRYVLPRHHESVVTTWGEVRMKIGGVNGTASHYAPEYEDCRRIAAEHGVPLKTVMQEAIRRYLDHKLDQKNQKNG